jgi:hypothetical protein
MCIGKEKTLQIANLIAFIFTIIVNYLANALPINGKTTQELSDAYPNLFTPAGLTFAIWGVIYFFLALFIIYQLGLFNKDNKEHLETVKSIGWLFVISSVANILWIFAWHYEYVLLSLIIMIILLVSLIIIYNRVSKIKCDSPKEFWFVKVPFSLYLGWITVATIANVTAFLVDIGWNGLGVSSQIWTIIVIALILIITSYFILKKKDIIFGLVIEWALIGILIKHITVFQGEYTGIILAAIISFIVILIEILYTFKKSKKLGK